IQIQASGGLSDDDIDQMVKDAEANADADKKLRESVDARNNAETLIHSSEKSLAEYGDKVSDSDKQAIEDAIAALKTAVEGDEIDADDVRAKSETLAQASMKLGEAMYAEQQAAAEADAAADDAADGDDDVLDADFEDVSDDGDEKKSA
ncbi:MAG: Hsp70 family protein, partial [Hyphomicrobiales bacterium]